MDHPVRTYSFESAEEAAAAVCGAQVRYVPLQRQISPWRLVDVRVGQSRLLCGRMGADTSMFGTLDRNLLHFLSLISGSGWKSHGKCIEERSLGVLADTTETTAWVGHSMHSTSLQVPVEKFARAYSTYSGGGVPVWRAMHMFTLDAGAAGGIRRAIRTTLRIARRYPDTLRDARVGERLEDMLIELLLHTVSTASHAERPDFHLLAARCNDYLATNADRCVTLCELRGILKVSDRTLRRFFMSTYGTSPARFLRIHRLHATHRILDAVSAEATITDTAMSFGFFDLGRFAGDYRRLFGELPSHTLRRAGHRSSTQP